MLRLCPERPLPPYSYVPGRFPHPVSHPEGHSYSGSGEPIAAAAAKTPALILWPPPTDLLFGIDLFNHAFYWEAHEIWEQLWIGCGRSGRDADFLKALIKLAAAGVKAREGNPAGVSRHAKRAHQLLVMVRNQLPDHEQLAGLNLNHLMSSAQEMATLAESLVSGCSDPIHTILPLQLVPTPPSPEPSE